MESQHSFSHNGITSCTVAVHSTYLVSLIIGQNADQDLNEHGDTKPVCFDLKCKSTH